MYSASVLLYFGTVGWRLPLKYPTSHLFNSSDIRYLKKGRITRNVTYPRYKILIQERKHSHRFNHQVRLLGQRTSCVSLLRTNMTTLSPDGEQNINNFIVCPDSFRTNSSLTTLCWAERDDCREKDTRFCVGSIEYRTWNLFPGGRNQRDWWSIERRG